MVGAEVLRGSTRLSAGTAQKVALNALTTTAMDLLGRVHGDVMVDVVAANAKLRGRADRHRRRDRRLLATTTRTLHSSPVSGMPAPPFCIWSADFRLISHGSRRPRIARCGLLSTQSGNDARIARTFS